MMTLEKLCASSSKAAVGSDAHTLIADYWEIFNKNIMIITP